MNDLIKSPLQKGGIDGYDRSEVFRGKACGKSNRVLFRYAHIQESFGKYL